MNKLLILLISLLSIILLFKIITPNSQLSPAEQTNVLVVVDNDFPIVYIHNPISIIYNAQANILINYTITDRTLDSVWYSLNNEKNITIHGPFYLNLSENNYTITIYANDSLNRLNYSTIFFSIANVRKCEECTSQQENSDSGNSASIKEPNETKANYPSSKDDSRTPIILNDTPNDSKKSQPASTIPNITSRKIKLNYIISAIIIIFIIMLIIKSLNHGASRLKWTKKLYK